MKCFNKKLKICSLLLAFLMIFSLSLPVVSLAEGENIDSSSEEDRQLEIENEEFENKMEEANREDMSVEGDTNFNTSTEQETEESEEASEAEFLDTFEYRFFKAAGFLVPEMYDLPENTPMTRAQFVSIASRLRGLGNVEFPANNSFWDVPANHWATSYIYGMRDMKYISGYTQHEFRPDAPITFGQALKITLCILGYEDSIIQRYGGYPAGYLKIGSTLDLLPGISSENAPITCEKAFELLYKATEVQLVEPEYTTGELKYGKSEHTILSQYHDIYEDEGVVKFDGFTGLDSDIKYGENQALIGKRLLGRGNIALTPLLGMKVTYFYRNASSGTELVFVEARGKLNEVLIINAEDLAVDDSDFSVTKICYYDKNDRLRSVDISPLAKYVYNGRSYDEFGSENYKIKAGSLKLISYAGSSVYDVIIAEEFENLFVSAVDLLGQRIYGSYGGVVELEESDYVTIFNEKGERITLEDVQKNNVVSYFYSRDRKNLVLHVSESKVSGLLSGVSDDGRGIAYTIGEEEYRLANNVKKAIEQNLVKIQSPELGISYDIYLDKAGNIAGIVLVDEKLQYALLCKYGMGSSLGSRDYLQMQMVLENGENLIAQTAKKLTVNGAAMTGTQLKTKIDTELTSPYPVIRVAFNSLGEVKEVEIAADRSYYLNDDPDGDETPIGYNEEKFTMDYAADRSPYRGYSIMFWDYRYRMNADTVVFHLPYKEEGDTIEPEEIEVVSPAYLTHNNNYKVTLYDADATLSGRAVVVQPETFSYFGCFFVVSKVTHTINEDGEDVTQITGFKKGVLTTLREKESGILIRAKEALANEIEVLRDGIDTTKVKVGDVFKLAAEGSEIQDAQLLYSCSAPDKERFIGTFSAPNRDKLYSNRVLVIGPVHAVSEYAVTTVNPDKKSEIKGEIAPHAIYNTVFIVYDSEEKSVRLGSIADIYPDYYPTKLGKDSEDNTKLIHASNTWVVIHRSGETAEEIIVIR